MSLLAQIAHGLFWAPLAPLRLRPRAVGWLLVYVLLAGGILGGLAWFLVSHQDDLRQALLEYLFPESWTTTAGLLVDRFLATQTRAVLINATVSGTLILISVTLFPVKEKLSDAFERGAGLTDEEPREFPLWFQAFEELKLVILFATAQMAIFWIGYHPNPLRRQAATILSYGYLFTTFSVDFVSPLLQRHRLRYSQILKTLVRHPLATLLFGALFSLPAVLAGHYIARQAGMPLRDAILLLFGANLLGIVWGCLGGTWLGARFLPAARDTRPSGVLTRAAAWLVLLSAFAAGSTITSRLALSLHHKTQILKCDYSVVRGSLRFARPRLRSLLRGVVEVGVSFKLRVKNPTRFDVDLDRNRLEVRHDDTLVAESRLDPMAVPAGEERVQQVRLTIETHPKALLKGRELLADRWSVTLFVEVMEGFDFPIYLRHTFAETVREQLLGKGR
jgi:uncharacterized protein involved in cysteine biosynthesis